MAKLKGLALSMVAAVAVTGFSMSTAQAADFDLTIPVGTTTDTYNFVATPHSDGSIAATFGHTGIGNGTFEDTYTFHVADNGIASGSLSTSTTTLFSTTDLDLTSVTINGVAATLTKVGNSEFASIDYSSLTAKDLNTIVVSGLSRGNGSYGGNATFMPTAVPEPASWAMMIGGIGFAGGVMRRRLRKSEEKFTTRVRSVAFNA